MRVPVATYRVQLGRDFTFDDAAALVPYLRALGISDCYTSPFFDKRMLGGEMSRWTMLSGSPVSGFSRLCA